MADLEHLHPVFRERVLATGVGLASGARSHARQQQLWNDFQAGRGNPANRPGTSWHEYDESVEWPPADGDASSLVGGPWALAVDFAQPYPHGADGLCWPIPGEPWHAQPSEVTERQRAAGAWRRLPAVEPAPPPAPPPILLDPIKEDVMFIFGLPGKGLWLAWYGKRYQIATMQQVEEFQRGGVRVLPGDWAEGEKIPVA